MDNVILPGHTVVFGINPLTEYPLFWNVIGSIHGLGMYLMCRNNIVTRDFKYNIQQTPVSYKDSTLRHYLVDIFYSKYFNSKEKDCVVSNPCMMADPITIPVFNVEIDMNLSKSGEVTSNNILCEAFPFNRDDIMNCKFGNILRVNNAICLTHDQPFNTAASKISTFSLFEDDDGNQHIEVYKNIISVNSDINVYPVIIVRPAKLYALTHILTNNK